MSSTPLMASSIGVATVWAITLGLAPGYCARTTIEGGTTLGYSAIGRARMPNRPATRIRIDSTPAKTGRSTKNLEKFMSRPPLPANNVSQHPSRPSGRHRRGRELFIRPPRGRLGLLCRTVGQGLLGRGLGVRDLRGHQRTRAHSLQPVDDDTLAGFE